MASKPKISRKKNGYEMPKKLTRGTKLVDNFKCEWIVGSSIGKGGFGEIYCVSKANDKIKTEKDYPYVLKIEPHQNGPLFVEMHFYMRNAKYDDIEAFKKSRKLKELGMPHFVGSGSQELEGVKHRFIIMPRYSTDIWSLYLKNGKLFPYHTAYRLALQMLDVLDYIHNCTYVHGDLKGANMLLKNDSQAYLVDFGLASHYTTSKEYKEDPKKMHNGTIEYTSIDAHHGVPTMRGDLEILGYNLIHWCGGKLPWEKVLNDPIKVQDLKEKFRGNAKALLKECFGNSEGPICIQQFLHIVYYMKFDERPNYDKCKALFLQALKSMSKTNSGPLQFENDASSEKVSGKKTLVSPNKKKASTSKTSSVRQKDKTEKETKGTKQTHGLNSNGSNATVLLSTPSKGTKDKIKKVYNVNIDLDISIDSDVVVNVRRKDKTDKTKSHDNKTPEKSNSNNQEVPPSSVDDVVETTPPRVSSRKRKQPSSDEVAKKSTKLTVSKPTMHLLAGVYKGKVAKQ